MELSRIIQEIQYVLAPAVMISSCSLLLLGFQNKFSSLANRFRVLNSEKRALIQKRQRDEADSERLENLKTQVDHLLRRATHVKNVILMTYWAIVCFIMTSILIYLNVYTSFQLFPYIIASFLAGLLLVLFCAILMMVEVALAFKVISLESKS